MAYVADNLRLVTEDVGGNVPRLFLYTTATDNNATLTGSGYFSDGVTKGLRVGDLVSAVATTGPLYKLYQVTSVSGAAATVSTPTAIT